MNAPVNGLRGFFHPKKSVMAKMTISWKRLDTVWFESKTGKERVKITAPGLGEKLKNYKTGSEVEIKFE